MSAAELSFGRTRRLLGFAKSCEGVLKEKPNAEKHKARERARRGLMTTCCSIGMGLDRAYPNIVAVE
jgi:hypothetical protein